MAHSSTTFALPSLQTKSRMGQRLSIIQRTSAELAIFWPGYTGRGSVRAASCSSKMISFANINKQYGKQLLFVDASFQSNPGEKLGLVGPNGRARQRYCGWWSARKLPTRAR